MTRDGQQSLRPLLRRLHRGMIRLDGLGVGLELERVVVVRVADRGGRTAGPRVFVVGDAKLWRTTARDEHEEWCEAPHGAAPTETA